MINTDTEWFRAESSYSDPSIGETTIPRMFFNSVDRNGPRDAQWYKGGVYDRSLTPDVLPTATTGEFASVTYDELADIVRSLAAGFRELGVEHDDRVGIYANTRMEWAQSDLALLSAGATVTTVYTESSAEQTQYLLDDPSATGVVCENAELLDTLLGIEEDLDLEFIVVIDEFEGHEDRDDILSLGEVYEQGSEAYDDAAFEGWLDEQSMDDLASLIYTSGTTGKPKGVQLTHRNFRANVNQVRRRFADRPDRDDDVPTLSTDTRALSFLPLAHVYERTSGHFVMFASGATVAYAESTDTIADDLATVKPTSATSVPRIYERVFATMREQASGSNVSESIFEWSIGVARDYARTENPGLGLRAKHALADRLVYSSVKETMGGNIEMFISGGGSLSQRLAELFEGMGLPIHEGYGLTETSPVVSTNPPDDLRSGTLGPPLTEMEAKLDPSVVSNDQKAKADGEIGELLLRGPNVTDGYWNRPDATESAFTDPEEGEGDEPWFRSGDIIEAADDGYLVYHDRLKQLIVLDTGKNVAPGPIEDEFATSERISQAMVVGDNEKFIAALFVPDMEALERWAEKNDIDLPDDEAAIATNERVREWVRAEVDEVNESLSKHEQIKEFRLVGVEWTPDNDMLTPSMKLKRRNVMEKYDHKIEEMYGRDEQ
ncbi:AMP-dependent synthetase/ligase [Halosegnis rubeus]|uniref:AMP-binding protein n=1 Tax=Halosegnis rubeus TaxID=2212850 RepID=A0A5N5U6Y5_9EURY|nr:long-chain fatty acid--CoA ligase [Halosegnis rubeus]KAB7514333.1 AMP-binding protein [Halosegnis rubeus]